MSQRPSSSNTKRQDALLALSLARSSSGRSPVNSALLQPVWFQDYVAGLDSNPGTALAPVRTAAEIKRRWQGGIAGTRPVLPVSQTINMVSPAPDFSDPLLVLADVDLMAGVRILVQPVAPTVKRSGTVTAIANAFARTPTGQLKINDVGVADWTSDVDRLLVDTSQQGVAWVIGGVSPAVLSNVRTAVNTASPPLPGGNTILGECLGPTVTIAPGDTYSIITPLSVYFGTGCYTRSVPNGGAVFPASSPAVVFSRLHGVSRGPLSDLLHPRCDNGFIAGASLIFSECRFDQTVWAFTAGMCFGNCAFTGGSFEMQGTNETCTSAAYSGYSRGIVFLYGGTIVDQDFACLGSFPSPPQGAIGTSGTSGGSGADRIGAVSHYGDGPALSVYYNGQMTLVPTTGVDVAIMYGNNNGAPIFDVGFNAVLAIGPFRTAAASFVFDTENFTLSSQASAFGASRVTGAFVGPTPCTLSRFDAALGAGSGFGGFAQDPPTGAKFVAAH